MNALPHSSAPPLPPVLKAQWADHPPLRIKSHIVIDLLVHWGFTETQKSGAAYVKKLVYNGALTNVMKPGHDWRFDTNQVLSLWHEMQN